MQKMRQGGQFQTSFCFLEKLYIRHKQVVCSLVAIYFDYPQLGYPIKTNCIKLQTIDLEILSCLIFQKRVQYQFLHYILCMIFQEKCCSDNLYFLTYLAICVSYLFASQFYIFNFTSKASLVYIINLEIMLVFLIELFFYMAKKSTQKFKYIGN